MAPTINRRIHKEKPVKYKSEASINNNDKYSSPAWRRLRDTYISLHPICQCCLSHEHIEPAVAVHHMIPWSRGENEQKQWELFLDEHNLMSVCSCCHIALHQKDSKYNLTILNDLTDKEWREAHGYEV